MLFRSTTMTTQSPLVYNYTLKVALVLNDPFVVRNASAPGGYSGFSVEVMQLVASAMGAKLSFVEVPFDAKWLSIILPKTSCLRSYQVPYLHYVKHERSALPKCINPFCRKSISPSFL